MTDLKSNVSQMKNYDPLVSIIVPTYNVKDYVEECVNSLASQTYQNVEIILVDDGSTDGSSDILDSLVEKDSRIKVFHKENGGTHSARNLGVEKSTGDYVMFIDPDDWFNKDCVESVLEAIKSTGADVVKFNYVKEFGSHFENKKNSLLESKLYVDNDYERVLRMNLGLVGNELKNIQDFNFLASVCFGCYKKEIITANSLKFTSMKEIGTFSDGLFNLSFLLKANSFYYLDKHLYHYRKNNFSSCTNTYRANFVEKNRVLLEKIYNLVNPEGLGQDFKLAYDNRVSYSVFELLINAGSNNAESKVIRGEIRRVVSDDVCKRALKNFKLRNLPIKWKVCYMVIKTRIVFAIYFLTKFLINLKRRG